MTLAELYLPDFDQEMTNAPLLERVRKRRQAVLTRGQILPFG